MPTMDEMYGDGSDHAACPTCGMCVKCGDCEAYGCGAVDSGLSTDGAQQTQHSAPAPTTEPSAKL